MNLFRSWIKPVYMAAFLSIILLAVMGGWLIHSGHTPAYALVSAFTLLSFAGAAVVITYEYPVATAGTTPPTVLQSLGANMVNALVAWADADTTTLVTHNFGMSTADLTSLFPVVVINNVVGATTTVAPVFTVGLTNSLAVTLGKGTIVGTQGTISVNIFRPIAIVR